MLNSEIAEKGDSQGLDVQLEILKLLAKIEENTRKVA